MTFVITNTCDSCQKCLSVCPVTAIYQGGEEWTFNEGNPTQNKVITLYNGNQIMTGKLQAPLELDRSFIVPEKCNHCGDNEPQCVSACPSNSIVEDYMFSHEKRNSNELNLKPMPISKEDTSRNQLNRIEEKLDIGFSKTKDGFLYLRDLLKEIISLNQSQLKEFKSLESQILKAREEDAGRMLVKVQEGMAELKLLLKDQNANELALVESSMEKQKSNKQKLILSLNLLFIKYEAEYDVLKLFKKVKSDIKNGNWFFEG